MWLYDYSWRNERPINLSRLVSRGSHSDAETRAGYISISWVSASSVTSRRIFNTTSNSEVHYHVLFMKGWCLYSSSVKQCLLSVNRDRFLRQLKENGKHKTTFHWTSGWKSSLHGEDLPSKLRRSHNGDLKSSASNEEDELVYRATVKPKSE